MDNAPDQDDLPVELPDIEFQSPGRFAVHNPPSEALPPEILEPAPFRLGEGDQLQRFSKPDDARTHALALIQQARRTLYIYTPDLEPWLYHHSSIQEACTQVLLGNPRNRLMILLRDSTRAVKEGHRLLNLSRHLSSYCQIRRINPDYPSEEHAFLLADDCGLLLRPEPGEYAGYAHYNNAGRVRQLIAQFEQTWNTSVLDPNLRSFLI
ncbi:DUF7931 domain-containing protein [Pseudomonas pseudonitroreducens]|uniref:DUF7931 domain-containing protein n=1 Tax=Pseudomonas pseudonitroreducens TaxID=2892326 RepID=UPI001F17DC54|nr:histone acetyltransferase HPA2 [Pseudomonas pseudonitroreducens]